jgi:hypothetical protein
MQSIPPSIWDHHDDAVSSDLYVKVSIVAAGIITTILLAGPAAAISYLLYRWILAAFGVSP